MIIEATDLWVKPNIHEIREAAFSEDSLVKEFGLYRYRLDITWDSTLPTLVTIGLNPSTATHLKDDPTIRACKEFAKLLGCGTLRMLNAFALRSTDYKALFKVPDPIGPENTVEFLKHWWDGAITVACWGSHITERPWRHFYRGHEIAQTIPNLKCWRKTKSGHPEHPLYLPRNLQPIPFAYADD